jgi:hypothetical protein
MASPTGSSEWVPAGRFYKLLEDYERQDRELKVSQDQLAAMSVRLKEAEKKLNVAKVEFAKIESAMGTMGNKAFSLLNFISFVSDRVDEAAAGIAKVD